MEIRRVADTLLRCQASPLKSTPSGSTSFSMAYRTQPTKANRRTFTSSAHCCIRLPPPITTPSQPDEKKSGVIDEFKSLFPVRRRSLEKTVNGGTSDQDLMSYWKSTKGSTSSSENSFSNMLMPRPGGLPGSIYDTVERQPTKAPKAPQMRLTPTTGRTVTVGSFVDTARAFGLLAQSCARNQVKRDFARQRFHERPGMKRKRLRSVRWRKRFKFGFKAAVMRVQQLRKQGW